MSKFSTVSLFSGLNDLNDVTLDPRYANICGYTDADLDLERRARRGDRPEPARRRRPGVPALHRFKQFFLALTGFLLTSVNSC